MYPDLENNRKSDSGYGSTLDSAKKFQKRKNGEGAVFECSKCWITSIAIICFVSCCVYDCVLFSRVLVYTLIPPSQISWLAFLFRAARYTPSMHMPTIRCWKRCSPMVRFGVCSALASLSRSAPLC